jgi:phospholipase/carboxylesterase
MSWVPDYPPQPGDLDAVAAWLDTVPFPAEQIVIGGWSQGALVALAVALAPGRPRPAGVVVLGGGLADSPPVDLAAPLPPVLIAHGREDDVVPVERARRTRDGLVAAGAAVTYLETDVGHEIDPQCKPAFRDFVAALL